MVSAHYLENCLLLSFHILHADWSCWGHDPSDFEFTRSKGKVTLFYWCNVFGASKHLLWYLSISSIGWKLYYVIYLLTLEKRCNAFRKTNELPTCKGLTKATVLQMLKKIKNEKNIKINGKYWSSYVQWRNLIITDPLIQLTNFW